MGTRHTDPLLERYRRWDVQRRWLNRIDTRGGMPAPNEWEWSDDTAVELLREFAERDLARVSSEDDITRWNAIGHTIAETATSSPFDMESWPVWRLTWWDTYGKWTALTTAASESAARQAWIEHDYGVLAHQDGPPRFIVDHLRPHLGLESVQQLDGAASAHALHALANDPHAPIDDHDPDTCQDPDCEETHRD